MLQKENCVSAAFFTLHIRRTWMKTESQRKKGQLFRMRMTDGAREGRADFYWLLKVAALRPGHARFYLTSAPPSAPFYTPQAHADAL